ncbi:DnaJ domain-containing protein [Phycomyces blakesleeanus]|uniref:J domain-containing protein n=2 Tax=Phycomyces blakesleeanus TaxID=4837 RepID=A0A162XV89_PHYB8|nr:hypothetical protein PHYBLDRAFT_165187 [Phycomyces blakesleeanus NRRL 1555(-)]OAD76665.1 hypothetical protein PHYBLDRAFT_165187 [Phycomyces blakesleeanus NRRL 1555(-)]|eukprot:XP_018294705.1 hypothetical protein PHYBLDRAFT_165187 [Phycomyces blakesleeanus NRRL 1555(-)]
MVKSPYEVLGVSPSSSPKEIKRRYLELCKKHHPDVNTDPKVKFVDITGAYESLTKPTAPSRPSPGMNAHLTRQWTRRSLVACLGLGLATVAYVVYEPSIDLIDVPYQPPPSPNMNYRQWRQQ